MSSLVLDASAPLALLQGEPGAEPWEAAIADAVSAVNLSEVAGSTATNAPATSRPPMSASNSGLQVQITRSPSRPTATSTPTATAPRSNAKAPAASHRPA